MPHYTNEQGREYITGQNRTHKYARGVTHLYDGDFANPGNPLCKRGWNREDGLSYSIWRGNISRDGICKVCRRRAENGLPGVPPRPLTKEEKRLEDLYNQTH
jgi:hypothetical protein